METIFVGIDVSKKSNHIRVLDGDGDSLSKFIASNNIDGAGKIAAKLKELLLNTDFTKVIVGMESTSVYADHLASFLSNDEFLKKWECEVFVLNAKQVRKFKDSYPELPKTDDIDAFVIADYLRFGRISKIIRPDDKYIALRNLTRARFQAAQSLSREKNRFLETLFYKFSTLDSSGIFSNTFGATSLAVVTDFLSVDDIIYTPVEELAAFINKKGKSHFVDPEKIAKELQAAARSSYRLPKTVNDSVNQLLAIRLVGIRAIQSQIKDLDKAIESFMSLLPNGLATVPGIGPVYCAGILAEIGDVSRFKNHAALAKYGGLAWRKHQSGGFEAANTKMILSGNKYLKYYLLEAANKVRMHDTEFCRFYSCKFKEVPKHQHKRALALTARKLVRLVYSLLSANRLYTLPTV
jgi:transposase